MGRKTLNVENETSKGWHAANYKRFQRISSKFFHHRLCQHELEFLTGELTTAHR